MLRKKIFDVIICVHNSPKYVRWCLESILKSSNAEIFNIIIVDDFSDQITKDVINEFKSKYNDIIEVITNQTNIGYVKSANEGIQKSISENIVMLNSDALVTKGWLEKFQVALQKDKKIGLISPLSNNAVNLSILMPPGFSFIQMNEFIEKNSKKNYPDAMTVVGHCLVVTRKVIDKIGLFDEIYSPAYTEETDYHFKAINNGFRAVIADDTYVFHKGESSITNRSELFESHLKIFMSRWGKQFKKLHSKYEKKNQLGYLRDKKSLIPHFKKFPFRPTYDVVFLLPSLRPGVGGIITVIEIVNGLIRRGINANVAYFGDKISDVDMLFEPIQYNDEEEFCDYPPQTKIIIATQYETVDNIASVSKSHKLLSAYFIQDYEGWFNPNLLLDLVKGTYDLIENKIVVSHWLKRMLHEYDGHKSTVLNVGVSTEEMYHRNEIPSELTELKKNCKLIVMSMLSDNERRGSVYFVQAMKELLQNTNDIGFVITQRSSKDFLIPEDPRIVNLGMIPNNKMANYLSACDVIVDSSLYHGFGLPGLEGMSCGIAAILTDVELEYSEDSSNCILIKPKDTAQIKNAVTKLRDKPELLSKLKNNARQTALKFGWEKLIENYVGYFNKLLTMPKTNVDRPSSWYNNLLVNKNVKKIIKPIHFAPPPQKLSKKDFTMSLSFKSFMYYTKQRGLFFACKESLKWLLR